MKTILKTIILCVLISPIFNSFSQRLPYMSPADTNQIKLTELPVDSNMFQVLDLEPSEDGASFMHFWWSGDNGFSFAPEPIHNHIPSLWNNDSSVFKMTSITTENYGSGGPPPITYNFTTDLEGSILQDVMGADTFLHVQTYRNAVIHDTMYLIVTYANPYGDSTYGRVKIETGIYGEICDDVLALNRHYFPNGERWDPDASEFIFTDLLLGEERSVLIPVRILDNKEDFLDMNVKMFNKDYSENSGNQGYDFFKIAPAVFHSHDPNLMIAESGAKNKCDYRGGNIHYTVKFQNDGKGRTGYVRVECHLDDKVDLNSIKNVTVPSRFYQYCREADSTRGIQGRFTNGCGAIWEVDYDTRVLTIEMHNIKLYSSIDPKLPRIDMARGQIEFDVLVRDNYIFGTPVIAHSEIFFDSNGSVVTNVAKTGCDKPISLIDGGGFQSGGQSAICQWIWWILGGLLLIILLLIILLIRSRKKRKRALAQLKKFE